MIEKLPLRIRLGSMLFDHVVICLALAIIDIPFRIVDKINSSSAVVNGFETHFAEGFKYSLLIGFVIYFCKDSINSRSIAKRVLKLQVIDKSTGIEASPLQCFIRNILIPIWPIEVLVTLVSPNRRMGDFLAGTKVVALSTANQNKKVEPVKVAFAILLSMGYAVFLYFLFDSIIQYK